MLTLYNRFHHLLVSGLALRTISHSIMVTENIRHSHTGLVVFRDSLSKLLVTHKLAWLWTQIICDACSYKFVLCCLSAWYLVSYEWFIKECYHRNKYLCACIKFLSRVDQLFSNIFDKSYMCWGEGSKNCSSLCNIV